MNYHPIQGGVVMIFESIRVECWPCGLRSYELASHPGESSIDPVEYLLHATKTS